MFKNTTTIVPYNNSNKIGNNKSTNCLINTVILCINFFNRFEPTLYKFNLPLTLLYKLHVFYC